MVCCLSVLLRRRLRHPMQWLPLPGQASFTHRSGCAYLYSLAHCPPPAVGGGLHHGAARHNAQHTYAG